MGNPRLMNEDVVGSGDNVFKLEILKVILVGHCGPDMLDNVAFSLAL